MLYFLEIFFGANTQATGIGLTDLPVSQFLKLSRLQTAPMKQMPVAFVESQPALVYV